MELEEKLAILADAAKYDASCASSGSKRKGKGKRLGSTQQVGICHSYTPDGRCVSLLKILLTNFCIFDCQYCINRVSSNVKRARFTPAEVVQLTLTFYKRNYIEGLFLSSGIIKSADHTMEQLGEVARALREDHNFGGYIHLKAVPGASRESITLAGRWADRLSANLELPTASSLAKLAPAKTLGETMGTMGAIQQARDEGKERGKRIVPAGQSTQVIVGATPDDDETILAASSSLYKRYALKRVYYSAYSPIPKADPRLPAKSPPLIREHRLYQADWLMRFYGFDASEIVDESSRYLDLDVDPKLAWALRHREFFPVDINRAPPEALLRVPGLGQRSVARIVRMRSLRAIRLEDLKSLGAVVRRARPFLEVRGQNPHLRSLERNTLRADLVQPKQIELFGSAQSALTGEV